MAKITEKTSLTSPVAGDLLHIVDVSDTTDGAAGSSKKIALSDVPKGFLGGISITGNIDYYQYIFNNAANFIGDNSSGACIVGGGRSSSSPNVIGSATKPTGLDFTPTDWAVDTSYVADTAEVAVIGGGYDHVCNQSAGVIAGGGHNFIKYNVQGHSAIGGGAYNVISAGRSVISGGSQNTITGSKICSFIGGGLDNNISGSYSSIPGGRSCSASGDYAFAHGRKAKALANGSFVISDSQDADIEITTNNTFAARFSGGFYFIGGDVLTGSNTDGLRISSVVGYGELVGVDNAGNGYNAVRIRTGSSMYPMTFNTNGSIAVTKTVTAPGTTATQTINKTAGRVNIAAGGTTVTVTNSLIDANSIIMAVAATNDTTARVKNVVAGSGSFVINMAEAVTAETAINFIVFN